MFIIFIIVLQIYSNKTVMKNFDKNVTLADYAIEVKGLPLEGITQEMVKNHFNQFGRIAEIYLARSYNGVLSAYKERAMISYDIGYYRLLETKGIKDPKKIDKLIEKMKKFDEKIENHEKNSNKSHDELPVIRAFVVFDNILSRKNCIMAYKNDKGCCKRLKYQNSTLKFLGNFPLRVQKTGAPENILWENLEISSCSRCLRRTVSLVCVFLALIASIVMVYSLKSYQDNLPTDSDCLNVNSSESFDYAKTYYTTNTESYCYCKELSISDILNDSDVQSYCAYFLEKISISILIRVSVSFGVIVINFVMKIIFRQLGHFEKANNKSAEQLKLMSKVFIATFINTALVILIVNANFAALQTYS